jgi:hypothetical protein
VFASIPQTIRKSISEVSQFKLLKLETGPYQHERRLCMSAGYERRGSFGDYTNDQLSVLHAETPLSPPLGFVSKFHCRIADIRGRQVGVGRVNSTANSIHGAVGGHLRPVGSLK